MEENIYNPSEDGISHINIYSKGKTELGRWLTNFSYSPFNHPVYGKFFSMEGFWYWIATGQVEDKFRELVGYKAKEFGKTLEIAPVEGFEDIIKSGIRYKLLSNKEKLKGLIDSRLPLTHYYVYGGKCVPAGYKWITEYIEGVRKACQDSGYMSNNE